MLWRILSDLFGLYERERIFMEKYSIREFEQIGKMIAKSIDAKFLLEENGFIIEKRDKKSSNYLRIHLVHNYVSELTDFSVERGSLYDKKPYVKEIIKDIENLCMTIPENSENLLDNVVTFLYTHGDRFSIINVNKSMIVSWISAYDRRKILEGKIVPNEIEKKRRKFKKIF